MRRLYHFALSPHSRLARLILAEKGVEVDLVDCLPWAPPSALVAVAPDGELPVLTVGERAVCGAGPVVEFIEETGPGRLLLPEDPFERAEARRVAAWANSVFFAASVGPLLRERVIKKLRNSGAPDTDRMRAALQAAGPFYDRLEYILDRRRWLAGEELTVADFAVAAQISVLDYTGDVPWEQRPLLRDWYALMKSRPAFRGPLHDRVKGMPPALHYVDLDF